MYESIKGGARGISDVASETHISYNWYVRDPVMGLTPGQSISNRILMNFPQGICINFFEVLF
jgi:hypothetical protein